MDTNHPRHDLKVCAEADSQQEEFATFLAHPVDENGVLLPEQPSIEKTAELIRDAETFARWGPFLRDLAPDVPR